MKTRINLLTNVKNDGRTTVNRRSTDGQSQRHYTLGLMKYAAIITLLLTLACGNVWGQTKVTTSNFYKLYSTSKDDCSTLVTNASFPSYAGNTFNANMNGTLSSVPSISTPHNFAGLNTTDKYYRIKMASKKTLTLTNVANVKKVTFYGNGSSSTRTISVSVAKVSGSGSTFSVTPLSLANSNATIVAYATEDFTGKSGYDANTYYTYTFTADGDVSLWGVYVECGATTSYRTFKSGEKIYFKDKTLANLGSKVWVSDGDKVYACFQDGNNDNDRWSTSHGVCIAGTSGNADAIFQLEVPLLEGEVHEWTRVIFTRGTYPSWEAKHNQTTDESPDTGNNLFTISNEKYSDKYKGSWSKYGYPAALVGDFNNWNPDANVFPNSGTSSVLLDDLAASTSYKFKVLQGESYCGVGSGTITGTTDPWWHLDGANDVYITTGTTGRYTFAWNTVTYYLGVYYPGGVFTKNKYIYFDVTSETYWNANAFKAQFYFKYVDSGSDLDDQPVECSTPLENYVYYAVVPNSDYAGRIQMNRYYNGGVDGTSNVCYAYSRGDDKKNCMTHEAGKTNYKDSWTPQWKTYCPPMSSASLSDNTTSMVSWQSGNGTSANPYLVSKSGTIKVSASATKAVPDPDMTPKYDFKVSDNGGATTSAQSGTGSTYDKGSLSANHTYEISLDAWNNYNSTDGTKNTSATHLWYKAVTLRNVVHTLTNVTKSAGRVGDDQAADNEPYTATFAANTGYNLPATITVKFGGTTKTAGTDYTWDSSTGIVSIPASKINGNVTIIIAGVAKTTALTFDPNTANHGTSGDGGATATYASGTLASVTHTTPAAGYQLKGYYTAATAGTKIINANGTLVASTTYTDGDGKWKSVLSELTLHAQYEDASYSVTHTLTDVTKSSGGTTATHGTNYTAVFAGAAGYKVPDAISVTIGGEDATEDTEYTWDSSTGTVVVVGDYITGAIVITVTGVSSCSTPADPDELAAGSISSSGVTFTITDDESPASYEIYYSTSSTSPTGSTVASTTTTSKTKAVTGLTANTTYYAWVRAVCNDDYKSDWVALTGSTFTTLAEGTKYYLFTPTSAPNPSHTGTLSGAFISPSATSSNKTIDTYTFTKNITFGGTISSISGQQAGDKNITYYNKTSSTKFTLYVDNTNGSQQILYISKIVEGETSVTVANCTIPASTAKSVEYTYETTDNTTFGFSVGNSQLVIYQIVAEEAGTAHKVAGENGYALNLNKGRVSCPLTSKADISVNGFLIKAPYSNYKFTNTTELQIEKDKESSTYIKFTTPASPGRLKLTYGGSGGVEMSYNTKASDDGATSITSGTSYTLSGSTTYYLVNTGTQTAKITKIEFTAPVSTYNVSAVTSTGTSTYGTVSAAASTLAKDATTTITAVPATGYKVTNWAVSGTGASISPSGASNSTTTTLTMGTADATVTVTFGVESYTLTWNTNGGSDLDCDGCTSGSTAYGTTLVAPSDPTLSNYTFDGWNTANDGSGSAAAATMPAANTTYYAAWKQTVTLTTGAQGEGGNQTPDVYLNGTGVSSFTAHTASGYTLQGYYTAGSGGTKVLKADGTFASANVDGYITSSKWSRTGAAPTLYAQWVASEDCSTSDFVIRKGDATEYQGCMESSSYNGTATSFTAGSPTTVGKAKMTISNYSDGGIKRPGSGNTFSIVIEPVSGYYLKSICWAGKVESGETVSYYWDDNSGSATTISAQTTSGTGVTYNAPSSTTKFTASYVDDGVEGGGIWWRNVQVEVCAAGGTTYNVTYNGNDETSGSAPTDATNYNYGGTVTVQDNGTLAKTNYTFAGWTTNNDGTGSSYVEDNTFSITANTTLYAKWTQAVTLDKNGGSTDGSATAVWNATGLTGITHAKPAAGYKLLGYYSASSDGTKVLNSDGSFAATNVTDYITSGKWSRTSATTLYAEYESAGALTWNLVVNSDTTALSTSSKTSSFTEILNSNMTNAALEGGLTYKKSKKTSLTGQISTPAYDAGKYVYVTFQVAAGYKFTPSMIQVPVQPVGNGEHKAVELRLTDTNTHSLVSGSATKCDGTEKGKKTTVTLAGNGTYFTGTVTLKIYVYPHAEATASENKCYRLGTPITIEGEVEEACGTMPSYTSMSYTTTTFAPNADASGSPITIVGGTNIDTYQWKYNRVNDRTSGTNCGTGTSLTPLTDAGAATDVTRYYWCEMTNDACGITIKSPAVAITVAAAKSDATVEWTDPASTPNYGGGGYTIKATVDQTGWDGNAADLVITAPAGINIYNVTSGTASSQKWVQADFDVQTSFDRTTYASNIPFSVSAAATASYNAISDDHNVSYSACTGVGEGSSYYIRMRKTVTKDGNYYHCANTDGWISPNISSSYSTGKAGTKMETDFDTVASSNTQYVWVRTYHANVNKVRIYADFRANDMTVSNVYKHTAYFSADSKYAVDYTAVYNGDEENENTGTAAQGYVDITLDEVMAANDILLVKFNDGKVRPLGAVITEGSAGSLNTYLQWSGGLADGATVDKNTTDAYFTYSASKITENTNTLGTITYSSSDPSVATVDATGKVAMVAAGSTTIKATLAASGCYKKAEISYTLNVTEVGRYADLDFRYGE